MSNDGLQNLQNLCQAFSKKKKKTQITCGLLFFFIYFFLLFHDSYSPLSSTQRKLHFSQRQGGQWPWMAIHTQERTIKGNKSFRENFQNLEDSLEHVSVFQRKIQMLREKKWPARTKGGTALWFPFCMVNRWWCCSNFPLTQIQGFNLTCRTDCCMLQSWQLDLVLNGKILNQFTASHLYQLIMWGCFFFQVIWGGGWVAVPFNIKKFASVSASACKIYNQGHTAMVNKCWGHECIYFLHMKYWITPSLENIRICCKLKSTFVYWLYLCLNLSYLFPRITLKNLHILGMAVAATDPVYVFCIVSGDVGVLSTWGGVYAQQTHSLIQTQYVQVFECLQGNCRISPTKVDEASWGINCNTL